MIKTNKQKIISLSIVVVAVLALAIGFSAFSNNLLIKAKLKLEPVTEKFSVVFSSNASELETENITPTVSGDEKIEAEDAIIDNSATNGPQITNLSATVKEPGDKVVYSFYSLNNGGYDAYLTNIIFNNAAGASFYKVCTADSGTTQSTVNEACNSIKVTIKVGTLESTTTNTVSNHLLSKGTSEKVTVTIEYLSGGSEADGPFTVEFGDIELIYRSVDESTSTNDNVSKNYGVGEQFSIKGENFYVIESTDTTVSLLAANNITLTTTNPTQSENAGTISFASENYWGEVSDFTFVYNENSSLYPYVEAYKTYLSTGDGSINIIDATLLSVNQLSTFGCEVSVWSPCESGNEWLYGDYWLGDAYNTDYIAILGTYGTWSDYFSYSNASGIRPVITVNKSDL